MTIDELLELNGGVIMVTPGYRITKDSSESLIAEFAFKLNSKNLRAFDVTPGELGNTTVRAYVQGMEGRRLRYKDLIANG